MTKSYSPKLREQLGGRLRQGMLAALASTAAAATTTKGNGPAIADFADFQTAASLTFKVLAVISALFSVDCLFAKNVV